jgi:ABC-type glycerol-3-phosphate transport system permease component
MAPASAVGAARAPGRRWSVADVLLYALAVGFAAIAFAPFFWTVTTSLMSLADIMVVPPRVFPTALEWDNYVQVFVRVPFLRWIANTVQVSVLATLGTLVSATLVAYSFARFRYPGREAFFMVTLATLMLPVEVTLIPTYLLFKEIGWLDSFLPLIVPFWFGGGAFNIFLMRQFFLSIPYDLDEAARIDGATSWRIFWQILMPLCRPALATMATLGFISHWNSFLAPLIFISSESKYLVAVGLRYFSSGVTSGQAASRPQDHLLMGAALMVALPCLILFFLAQKYFVQGIVMSGIKG